MSGVDPKVQDLHSDTITNIQESLAAVIKKNTKKDLQQAQCYGVICDESTDLSVHKKLIMYVRYVNTNSQELETKLLGNIRIPDGTASTIATRIQTELKDLGLDMSKLVGLGSDDPL